jgi:hypothetical protein
MKVCINLTPEQTEQLRPLVEKIVKASNEGKPGMVIGQAWPAEGVFRRVNDEYTLTRVTFDFIEHDTTMSMIALFKACRKEEQP